MPSLSFQPTTSGPFSIGDTVLFVLVGEDLPSLSGVFFDLTYDASLLSYQGAEFDSRLDFVIDRDEPAGASGVITLQNIQGGSFAGDPSGDFTVVTLTFEVLAAGSASVAIAPRSSDGRFLVDSSFSPVALDAPDPADIIVEGANTPPVASDDAAVTDDYIV